MTPKQAKSIKRTYARLHQAPAPIRVEILTNTRVRIVGLTKPQTDLIDEALSFPIEGAFFSGKVNRHGGWDGKKHMLSVTVNAATFPRGLLHRVEQLLQEGGWRYDVADLRDHRYSLPDLSHLRPDLLQGVRFEGEYAYQLAAVEAALSAEGGILWLATNAGKTEIATAMILLFLNHLPPERNILFVVPNKKLLRDTRERIAFRLGTIPEHIGMIGDGTFCPKRVTVAVINSLAVKAKGRSARRYAVVKEYLATIGVLFLDEGHHSRSHTWYQTAMKCQAQFRYSLSGTPFGSGNGLMVEAVAGPVLARVTNEELMDLEVSARATIEMLNIDEPVIDASLGLSWDEVYTEGIVNNTYRNARLVEAAVQHAKRKEPVLFLVQRKWHGRNVAEMLTVKKIDHAFVHGELSPAAIDGAMDDLKAKEIAVLVSTAELLGEGVDIPELDALVLADGGKSPRALLQKIGRALRRKKGRKNVVRVYDCADLTHRWLADHALKRLDIFRAEGFEVIDAA